MGKFRVIAGIKKKEIDYCAIYSRVFTKVTNDRTQQIAETGACDKDTIRKIVYYGIKFVNQLKDINSYEGLIAKFQLISWIKEVIGELTPREFMTIFPISKEYKGKKFGIKDYYSTMEAINEIGIDTKIGESVSEFLFNYHDWNDIFEFCVTSFTTMSEIKRKETGKGLTEEVFPDLKTYTMCETGNKKILIDNETGQTSVVKQPRPRYLKIID
ncbi:hypothetical protein ACS47_13265 [Bacillus cereus]|uniref:Uncharacterized protein n=4 Tax=root TaxID=1 RepID=B5LPL4_9CAUD|nr:MULTISPECIES: hypothetical protein [Bacteria]YP_002154328.1 hypothetical protein IEBH_gp03 [Bacillus phage IEBH]YP_009219614.1 hypothetical protein AVT71_gp40 [Bacillus phage 250]EJR03471.1 hypothetical protein II7_05677 [Bacillus cereus MSX-A12]KLA04037.1 hypothetical protein B4153_5902 [Bacillus cereus]MRA63510.1 hypothetical protein [Bacillus thuringiensis]OUB93062.1 hypothetical protein BK752_27245 [Bacillus thuringiensis serovar canadensis]HDR7248268.1 hypothetical protein [Bacillus 